MRIGGLCRPRNGHFNCYMPYAEPHGGCAVFRTEASASTPRNFPDFRIMILPGSGRKQFYDKDFS
ncbi:hypothetical protein AXF15_04300 [Desulfomicrobium orale DSM 12838]|uniref:Uncharacterized protein n=1 Tax=Desulfomicrobium orale DSM 12838 TaxID=888061 RepID=A0A0X8JPA7_9BACT|nr:hypothetical protein AXF15_04300 [Desulfomicrobium orale DSM 12838]